MTASDDMLQEKIFELQLKHLLEIESLKNNYNSKLESLSNQVGDLKAGQVKFKIDLNSKIQAELLELNKEIHENQQLITFIAQNIVSQS